MVVLEGHAPVVAQELEVAIGGAQRDLELERDVGGADRLARAQPLQRPQQAPQGRASSEALSIRLILRVPFAGLRDLQRLERPIRPPAQDRQGRAVHVLAERGHLLRREGQQARGQTRRRLFPIAETLRERADVGGQARRAVADLELAPEP